MHQITTYYYLLLLLAIPFCTQAANHCPESLAEVISFQGKVDTQQPNQYDWKPLSKDTLFCFGDKIRTSKNSRTTLKFKNGPSVTLDQNSTLTFSVDDKNESSWITDLIRGSAFFRSRHQHSLPVRSPWMNVVHKGTEFLVTVDSEQTKVTVFDGQVAASNSKGEILIEKGYIGIAGKNQAPQIKALTVRPEDAVQWSLYYPAIIDYQKFDTTEDASLQSSINTTLQNNPYKALTLMEAIPASQQNAEYLTLKASLLLLFGSVEEAKDLIDKSLVLETDNSTAIALQSIIAVTKNRQDKALDLAQKAVTHDPQSAVAQIALSYAYQSKFDIESALKATQEAISLSPDNALAWSRLSELQLSTGEREKALKSAKKAKVLNPKLGRTQTILGFASLAQVEIDQAKTAFNQAINLDAADPLAHLGLGLAKIRKGNIEEGTSDIETAVSLDPDNAIMRSYLGKAYYELKNDDYAATELAIAKEKDPNDPTPWFYDAIRKQTTNRPVEALHDMQKAIELNDNRGVYRSKLLLDEDLAARSASLGRIYNDLGFQRLGLIEGWKSVNTDPSNYSAHRLLADNYASQPRHEIARVSELLQSQLLQPINITPVQPQLAQSNILVVDGLGPSSLSFNEYNPLFTRNRFSIQASGIIGGNNTWGDDIVHSGLWDNISYSLGQFHYETDGFRKNNFVKQDIYNAFIQSNVTNSLNLQAEYRHEERENGDLSINFDPTLFSFDFKENRDIETFRLGGRYTYSPNSSYIGSFNYQKIGIIQKDTIPNAPVLSDTNINRKGVNSEIQHQYNGSEFNSVTGIGHIHQTVTRNSIRTLIIPGIPPRQLGNPTVSTPDITRINLYNYSTFDFANYFTMTLGLSFDHFEIKNQYKRNKFNPKFGITWEPVLSTTFRVAAFRGLSINRTASQTIEPTQIAGFNQLFDDPNGTISWRYGSGIDHKISENISVGLEYSERKLDVPFGKSAPLNWQDKLGKAYLYLTPHNLVSLSVEYFYEKFDRQLYKTTAQGIDNFKTKNHRIPLTLNLFHPSGFSFMLKGTYINQSGIFQNGNTLSNGSSDFFIVDLGLNYRLLSRYGIISFGVKNLFDNEFQYDDSNPRQKSNSNENFFARERTIFTRLNISF